MEIFEQLLTEWHHRGRDPVEGASMTALADIKGVASDINTAISNADQWLTKAVQEHVPQILAVVEKYQSSPIVQALEAVMLPPEVEQQVAGIIATLGRQYPAAPAVQEAPPEQPADEAPQG